MKRRIWQLLMVCAFCALPFIAFDLRNWIQFGRAFNLGDTLLDDIMFWVARPGSATGAFFATTTSKASPGSIPISSFNDSVFTTVQITTNALLYGFILWSLRHWRRRRLLADGERRA